MKSKFKKLLATALVLCLVLALLPAAAFAAGENYTVSFVNMNDQPVADGEYALAKMTATGETHTNGQFDEGENVTLSFVPSVNEQVGIFALEVNGSAVYISSDPRSFTYSFQIEGNTTVKAEFHRYFDVEATCSVPGAVEFEYLNGAYMSEQQVVFVPKLTGTYATTHEIQSVYYGTESQDGTLLQADASGNYTFDMPAGKTFVNVTLAERSTYDITIEKTGEGTVSTTPSGSAAANQTVAVNAIAAAGASVKNIVVYKTGDPSTKVTYDMTAKSFVMPNYPVTVSVEFGAFTPPTTEYSIYCAGNITGGEIWSNQNSAKAGDVVTIYVDPDWGWMTKNDVYYMTAPNAGIIGGKASFNGYAANGDEIWTFKMPASNVWVYAEFAPYFPGHDYHAITVTSDGHCDVSVPTWAYCGDNVTINLSNFDTGYAFSYLKVNGEYVTPYGFNGYLSYTFTMPHNNVAIEVGTTSVSGKYYIDTSYDSTLGGVEVWVNNNYVNNWHQGSWADYKDSVSFKVKPYYSDDVVSVSVVGKRTGWTYSCDYNSYSGWYTFSMPSEDVTINVDFRSGVHKVYVDKVTDGKLTVSDDWAKYGQIVYITAVPDYGCTLSSLSVRTATGDSVHVYNAQKADTYYFYMPDQYVSVSAVFTGKYTSLPFNDVSYGDWYYDAVQFVYSKGIMDGVDYYKFAPNGTITRGMILTMLWRMAGEPFEMPVTSFTDVEIGRYYTTAVAWACRNGIADGMGESTFGPNDAITREELVTLLYRYAQYFGHSCIGTSIEGFADAGSVSSYAYNAMCWAYKAGVVTGTTGSRLNPQGTASRAEAAQMIMSFYSFLNS